MRILLLIASLITVAYMQVILPIQDVILDINLRNIVSIQPKGSGEERYLTVNIYRCQRMQCNSRKVIASTSLIPKGNDIDFIAVSMPVIDEANTFGYKFEFRSSNKKAKEKLYEVYVNKCHLFMGVRRLEMTPSSKAKQMSKKQFLQVKPLIDISVRDARDVGVQSNYGLVMKACYQSQQSSGVLDEFYQAMAQQELQQFGNDYLLVQMMESRDILAQELNKVWPNQLHHQVATLNKMIDSRQSWFIKYLAVSFNIPVEVLYQYSWYIGRHNVQSNIVFIENLVKFATSAYVFQNSIIQAQIQESHQPSPLGQVTQNAAQFQAWNDGIPPKSVGRIYPQLDQVQTHRDQAGRGYQIEQDNDMFITDEEVTFMDEAFGNEWREAPMQQSE